MSRSQSALRRRKLPRLGLWDSVSNGSGCNVERRDEEGDGEPEGAVAEIPSREISLPCSLKGARRPRLRHIGKWAVGLAPRQYKSPGWRPRSGVAQSPPARAPGGRAAGPGCSPAWLLNGALGAQEDALQPAAAQQETTGCRVPSAGAKAVGRALSCYRCPRFSDARLAILGIAFEVKHRHQVSDGWSVDGHVRIPLGPRVWQPIETAVGDRA
jgi:hypothetical protein